MNLGKHRMRKNKSAIYYTTFLLILLMFFISACQTGAPQNTFVAQEVKSKDNPYANAEITTKIIPSINDTFGYDILLYGKPLIHQPSIPGLPGNEGFTNEEKAQKVADFVVKKIRNNEMPPTVTIDDLNTMGY